MFEKLSLIEKRFEEISHKMMDPAVFEDPAVYRDLTI